MERKVYIILTDTGTLFTRLIKLYTRQPYNHASISFDEGLKEVYSFGRKRAGNPFIGGFIKEDIQSVLFKQARCAIYCCTVTSQDLQKMNGYIDRLEEQKHLYRYNLLGLFALAFNKQMDRDNAFFCSEFVAAVLKESERIGFKKPISLITPNDLLQAANFELMYEGMLTDFQKKEIETEENTKIANAF